MKWVIIALGGAIGTVARYFCSGLDYRWSNGVFPVSTLLINLAGSLAIGFLWGLFERAAVPPNARLFVLIGLLGGFTTFSTFSLESFNLIRDGEWRIALWNVGLSNIVGIALVFVGYAGSRALIRWFE
ncbi:MAG TPA: fluoride efflux transporter CrcB [Nitrospiria bacterium]|nr:fluoride efflux transporter CrcB [Nitrospiria bacterium]